MKLTNDELNMVEAIYICIRDQKLRLYEHNIYAYIYLDWLVSRWHHLRPTFDSLPERATAAAAPLPPLPQLQQWEPQKPRRGQL